MVVHGLINVQKGLPGVEARVSELTDKLIMTNQAATRSMQNIKGILDHVMSSHKADLEQLGQAQSNEFGQIKQLIHNLSMKIDTNTSIALKVTTTYFC